jgi:prepilin-type N-terminal cleavage/methylation domain-containing protein
MISAAKTSDPQRGFTLIEIVIVLALAAVLMGSAIGIMAYSSNGNTLRKMSGSIELMAKQARTIAILHQTPYALEFSDVGVRIMPFAEVGMDTKKSSPVHRDESDPAASDASDASEITPLEVEDGMELSIRRWNSDVLLTINKKAGFVWRFDPDGLCEPISIRLALKDSWLEDTYHPLTAAIRDSQSEIR